MEIVSNWAWKSVRVGAALLAHPLGSRRRRLPATWSHRVEGKLVAIPAGRRGSRFRTPVPRPVPSISTGPADLPPALLPAGRGVHRQPSNPGPAGRAASSGRAAGAAQSAPSFPDPTWFAALQARTVRA